MTNPLMVIAEDDGKFYLILKAEDGNYYQVELNKVDITKYIKGREGCA